VSLGLYFPHGCVFYRELLSAGRTIMTREVEIIRLRHAKNVRRASGINLGATLVLAFAVFGGLTATVGRLQAEDPKPAGRLDLFGDPLPPGAHVRLGTLRWRDAGSWLEYAPDGKSIFTANPATQPAGLRGLEI
jgi:hypothetical protein